MIHVLRQAEASCISYPLPEGMSDKDLSEKLYPPSETKPVFRMPDYEQIHKELQRNGVTLKLLWLEYCEQCRLAGELPYQSTQFNKYYNDYVVKMNATMHLEHKPGEIRQSLTRIPEREYRHISLFRCCLAADTPMWKPFCL